MGAQTGDALLEAQMQTYSSLPVFLENTGAAQTAQTAGGNPFVVFRIATPPEAAFELETGADARESRQPGLAIASIHMPLAAGTKSGLTHADAIAALFRRQSFSTGNLVIQCREPNIRRVGQVSGGTYQIDVEVPFVRDELFTVA